MPCYLSAAEYSIWWELSGDGQPEDDARHPWHFEWETRFHLAKKWNLEGLDNDQLKLNPKDIPDNRILGWFLAITQPIVVAATSLPNSPKPSNDTEITSENTSTANEKKTA